MVDGIGNRLDAYISQLFQANLTSPGRVNQQISNAVNTVAVSGSAPHIDIDRSIGHVNVADFFAGQHIGR